MNWRWYWRGEIGPGGLSERWLKPRSISTELRAELDAHWRQRLDEARRSGQRLFDAPVTHFDAFRGDVGGLDLSVRPARYREWDYSSGRHEGIDLRFGEGTAVRAVALCAALLTGDGQLLIQRRSGEVAEGAGMFHVPGGHLDPERHRVPGEPAVWRAMREELREELSLQAEDMDGGTLLGFGENLENGKPELLFRFHCRLSASELRTRAADSPDAYEYSELLFIPAAADSLAAWLADNEKRLAVPSQALLSRLAAME